MNNDFFSWDSENQQKKILGSSSFFECFPLIYFSLSQLQHHYSILKFYICLQVKCVTVILSHCLKTLFLLVNYLLFSRFWMQHLMISSPLFNPGSIRFCVCYCTWQPSIRYSVLQRLLEISANAYWSMLYPALHPVSLVTVFVSLQTSNKCCSIGGQGVRLWQSETFLQGSQI